MYDHIEVDSTKLAAGSVPLDRMVRRYFKAVPPQYRDLGPFPGTFFGIYNFGSDSVWQSAKYWFRWPSLVIHSLSAEALPNAVFFAYPAIFMLLNIYFIGAFCWLFVSGRRRRLPPFFIRCVWLLAAYLAVNFAFSIFATPVVLRYQVIPYLLLLSYSLALLELTDQTAPTKIAPISGSPPAAD